MTPAILPLAVSSQTVRSAIATGGYPALALLVLLENLFPPIPSEVVLPLAGYYVERGTLAFVPAVAASTAGPLAGALILYGLGRLGGRPLVLRYGRLLRVDDERLRRAEDWFARYGDAVVLLGRMVPDARSVVSVPAGLARMGLIRFCVLTTLGSAAWNALLIGAGWALGAYWRGASDAVRLGLLVVLVVVAAAAVVVVVVRRRSRRARGAGPPPT